MAKLVQHLESFNGILKRKHLRHWQRGGHRLRVDVLLKLLTDHIVPSIFEQRAMEREARRLRENQVLLIKGGKDVLTHPHATPSTRPTIAAYLIPDPARDAAAQEPHLLLVTRIVERVRSSISLNVVGHANTCVQPFSIWQTSSS